VGHVVCTGEVRYLYRILIRKLKGRDHKEDLGINNIRIDLRDIEWEVVGWILLVQDTDQ